MKYQLSYDRQRELIVARVEGYADAVLVQSMAAELKRQMSSSGCRKLLTDLRSASIARAAFDFHNIPRLVDKLGRPIPCRRALVVTEASEALRSLEALALSAGQAFRVFTELDAALDWLQGHEPGSDEPGCPSP
jgi:hypothetical protein